jgi:hypothetical protein
MSHKVIRLPIRKIAVLVKQVADSGASAVYLAVDGIGARVSGEPDGGAWLAEVKWDLVNEGIRTKRAAEMTARVLINRAADHLNAYPCNFDGSIAHVNVPRVY